MSWDTVLVTAPLTVTIVIVLLTKKLQYKLISSKQDIIANTYFDRAGYGNRATTLADARKKDKTIPMADINEFVKTVVEEKRKPRGEIVLLHLMLIFQIS